ncbi:MAG: [acyl-carrier-protein] S-malonyltransferase [Calditrichaeota bacterium]|nr:MAG: [acyl-carrier-protein] S-malonyltransferase [Calditrichota bacterium]
MGMDLYEHFDQAKSLYERANAILDFDLIKLCFEGPDEELAQTEKTQPALFVHSYIVNQLLRQRGITPVMTAGHSLGEYSALAAAGVLQFEQGLRLVQMRGKLMQNAGGSVKGTMAAIVGLDYLTVHHICQLASHHALVDLANFNSPDQIVISGTIAGVEAAMQMATERGAKRVVQLNVSGAFHSPLMKPVIHDFIESLEIIDFKSPTIPVFTNVTGQATTDAVEIKMFLEKQLLSPVLWTETIKHMIQGGAETFIEVGPGKVLTGLLKKIDRTLNVISLGSFEQLDSFFERYC